MDKIKLNEIRSYAVVDKTTGKILAHRSSRDSARTARRIFNAVKTARIVKLEGKEVVR